MEDLNWDFNEVLITSYENGVSIVRPKTGTEIKKYKITTIAPKCLALLGEDYFISASLKVPDIKMWPIGDKGSSAQINSPCGIVNALAVSNCGTYCVASFKQEIRVWNVQSGELLSSFTRHYQDVTVLRFSSDDSIFISASKDGNVQAWLLTKVTCANLNDRNRVKPLHTWKHHTKEITDIFVGFLGIYSRIATSSLDMTCRIYELNSGLLLTTVCLDVPVTSVTMDSLEHYLILGTQNGTICKINLYYEQPRELHNNSMEKNEVNAHANAIISLSMSIVGDKFVSAALDSKLKLWEVASLACILCVQCPEGPYHNAFFALHPTSLTFGEEPSFFVKQLDRTMKNTQLCEISDSIIFKPQDKELSLIHAGSIDQNYHPAVLHGQSGVVAAEAAADDVQLENKYQGAYKGETINEIKEINAQMYSFMLDQVFRNIPQSSSAAAAPPRQQQQQQQQQPHQGGK